MNKKAVMPLMLVFEILIVVFVIYMTFELAQKYASSETANKVNLAEDVKMMVDVLVGTPGEALIEYPGNVSKYTLLLNSNSIRVFIKGDGELKTVMRQIFLPTGYTALGTLEEQSRLCLLKEKQQILLQRCG